MFAFCLKKLLSEVQIIPESGRRGEDLLRRGWGEGHPPMQHEGITIVRFGETCALFRRRRARLGSRCVHRCICTVQHDG